MGEFWKELELLKCVLKVVFLRKVTVTINCTHLTIDCHVHILSFLVWQRVGKMQFFRKVTVKLDWTPVIIDYHEQIFNFCVSQRVEEVSDNQLYLDDN